MLYLIIFIRTLFTAIANAFVAAFVAVRKAVATPVYEVKSMGIIKGIYNKNIAWSYDPDTGTLTVRGIGKNVSIPIHFNCVIGAFLKEVKHLKIYNIPILEEHAFLYVHELQAVNCRRVRKIETNAFYDCENLTSIEGDEFLEEIGKQPYCPFLKL